MASHADPPFESGAEVRVWRSAQPPLWECSADLDVIRWLNFRVISACARMALRHEIHCVPRFLARDREGWASLTTEHCEALAQMPFAVLDLRFSDAEWWMAILSHDGCQRPAGMVSQIPMRYAAEWARELLAMSLRTADRSRFAARLMFGMTARVADRIGAASDVPVGKLAPSLASGLRLRWGEAPKFWSAALAAVQSGKCEEEWRVHRHAFQLLHGETGKRA
jgi:hypothetical protein